MGWFFLELFPADRFKLFHEITFFQDKKGASAGRTFFLRKKMKFYFKRLSTFIRARNRGGNFFWSLRFDKNGEMSFFIKNGIFCSKKPLKMLKNRRFLFLTR
jgi:hypothetical protein